MKKSIKRLMILLWPARKKVQINVNEMRKVMGIMMITVTSVKIWSLRLRKIDWQNYMKVISLLFNLSTNVIHHNGQRSLVFPIVFSPSYLESSPLLKSGILFFHLATKQSQLALTESENRKFFCIYYDQQCYWGCLFKVGFARTIWSKQLIKKYILDLSTVQNSLISMN